MSSSTLQSLGTEVLGNILRFLHLKDLCRLFLSTPSLHCLFRDTLFLTTPISSSITPNSIEEAVLRRLYKLVEVRLHFVVYDGFYLQSPLQILPPTVISISITAPHDQHSSSLLGITKPSVVLQNPLSADVYLPLASLFPVLQTLVLEELYCSTGLLPNLPQTLTKLVLPQSELFSPQDLQLLPPHLVHLHIPFLSRSCATYHLPESLEYLSTSEIYRSRIRLNPLPSIGAYVNLPTLQFVGPTNLKTLAINHWSNEIISPVLSLSSSITDFSDLSYDDPIWRPIAEPNVVFPSCLTRLNIPHMDWEIWRDNTLPTFKFPEILQSLAIGSLPFGVVLPQTLKSLNVAHLRLNVKEKMESLPHSLTELDFEIAASQFQHISLPPALTRLTIKVKHVQQWVPLILPPSSLPRSLITLSLTRAMLELGPSLALLPSSLLSLTVTHLEFIEHTATHVNNSIREASYSFLPAGLKTLDFHFSDKLNLDALAYLPRGLTSLSVHRQLKLEHLSLLPPSLTYLHDFSIPDGIKVSDLELAHEPLRPCLLEWITLCSSAQRGAVFHQDPLLSYQLPSDSE